MAVFDALFLLLVLIGCIVSLVVASNKQARNRIAAFAPDIAKGDSLATMKAKSKNFHRVVEAVRIFHEIQQLDSQVPILPELTKKEIEAFLTDYYKEY